MIQGREQILTGIWCEIHIYNYRETQLPWCINDVGHVKIDDEILLGRPLCWDILVASLPSPPFLGLPGLDISTGQLFRLRDGGEPETP